MELAYLRKKIILAEKNGFTKMNQDEILSLLKPLIPKD